MDVYLTFGADTSCFLSTNEALMQPQHIVTDLANSPLQALCISLVR